MSENLPEYDIPTPDVPQALTPCGPLCDQNHKVSEPHNRNRAPVEPQDHLPAQAQRAEATDEPIELEWDGETWTVKPSDSTGLEFLAELADAEDGDPTAMIRALRLLLGRDQAARLFKGRSIENIQEFFEASGKAVGAGNR